MALIISRKALDDVKADIELALALLTDQNGLKVMARINEAQLEVVVLQALSAGASLCYGRFEPVKPADIDEFNHDPKAA
jgi:hypothetical protein